MNLDRKSSENKESVPDGPTVKKSVTFEDVEQRLFNLEKVSQNQKDDNKDRDMEGFGKSQVGNTLTFEMVEQRLSQLEALANVPKVNYQGKSRNELNSELLKAAQSGETQNVSSVLQAGADVDTKDEASGDSALHLSAARGHDDVVETLLDQGLDVDTRGAEERTALMAAAMFSRGSTVKLLLDRGARLDLRNKAD